MTTKNATWFMFVWCLIVGSSGVWAAEPALVDRGAVDGVSTFNMAKAKAADRAVQIPTIDLSGETEHHVFVARGTDEVYQGHPSTLLMPDGNTIYCVWTINHGGPCGPLKRSDDGGKTWSDLLAVPGNWRETRNCPTLFRLVDPSGRARLFVYAGQGPDGTMHQSYSEDGGKTWSPMKSNGLTCVMPFCAIVPVDGGKRLLAMSNIRRPNETKERKSNVVAQCVSEDGGFTWGEWRVVLDIPGCKPCEPELVCSPDGKQLLCLMRENNREFNAWMMTSRDEGRTWSEAEPLPASLSGDRHTAAYAPDGRLVICFRDTAQQSPTRDSFVAWVGTFDDIVSGGDGLYRVKLLHSYAGFDCGYPGLEVLPDGTHVATTYVKYEPGPRKHSVVSVRFTLGELDRKVRVGEFLSQKDRSLGAPDVPNLAQVASATGSSKFRAGNFPAANAVDGRMSLGGRWISDSQLPHTLTLTWDEEKEIERVRVFSGFTGRPGLAVEDYTIQYSHDGEWLVAASVKGCRAEGPEECSDTRFDPVLTDKLRIEVTKAPDNIARIFEIEVYGPEESPGPLGEEPQLFVDDRRIERRSGVVRQVHACRKLPRPVMQAEMPWEGDEHDSRIYVYGTVFRDPKTGRFRLWYNHRSDVLYATSENGVDWTRPKLGLVEWEGSRENNILPIKLHSPSIVLDQYEATPNQRYKALGYLSKGYHVAHSPDGLSWNLYPKNPVLSSGDTCTLCQNPESREFLAFHKVYTSHRGHRRRLVYLSVSKDMQQWTPRKLVMAPDMIDDAQTRLEGGLRSEFYNMSCFPYGGQFLGLVTHFRFSGAPEEEGPEQSPHDGPIDVQLVHSRDGRHWNRLWERVPVIPNGPYAYDAGCILGTVNSPVIVDDEIWIYYTAITTTHGGFLPKKRITIARAVWRRDGFVSLDAGGEEGTVETVALEPIGNHLYVNADASGGELRVEILGADSQVVPGYEAKACKPIKIDSVRSRVHWRGHNTLPTGKPIRLRFYLKNTKLFSYAVRCASDG